MKIPLFITLTGVLAGSLLQAAAETPDPHPDTLRVISYNTLYVFNEKKEMKAGKEWLKERTPDIVGLQELTGIKPELLQTMGESWGHQHSLLLKSSGFSVGLTSRTPIETVEKGLENMHHGFLHARSSGIEIFVVHLSPFKWEVRQGETDILIGKIKPLIAAGKKVMVLGDFNSLSPADAGILEKDEKALAGALASDAKHDHVQNLKDGKFEYGVMQTFFDAGLIDSAKDQLPLTAQERMSFPTGILTDQESVPEKGKRIDFILTDPEFHKAVHKMSIPRKGALNRISDHYPVVVDFQTPG